MVGALRGGVNRVLDEWVSEEASVRGFLSLPGVLVGGGLLWIISTQVYCGGDLAQALVFTRCNAQYIRNAVVIFEFPSRSAFDEWSHMVLSIAVVIKQMDTNSRN